LIDWLIDWLIDLLHCLCPLWLAKPAIVVTFIVVLRQWIAKRYMYKIKITIILFQHVDVCYIYKLASCKLQNEVPGNAPYHQFVLSLVVYLWLQQLGHVGDSAEKKYLYIRNLNGILACTKLYTPVFQISQGSLVKTP